MFIFQPNRELHRTGIQFELISQIVDDLPGIRPLPIQFVDECQSRDVVSFHLTVDSEGLRLDAGDAAKDEDSSVEDAEGALYFDGEVHVAGSVNDVDVLFRQRIVCVVLIGLI